MFLGDLKKPQNFGKFTNFGGGGFRKVWKIPNFFWFFLKASPSAYTFLVKDFIDRVPLFYPEGYSGFRELTEDFNPFEIPEGEKPNTWMINITGFLLIAFPNNLLSSSGDQPGVKGNDMYSVIVTKSTSIILFKYRELRRLRFKDEGKYMETFENP